VARLRDAGHRVHAVPTVATEALPFQAPDPRRYDWVVVTSATGARALLDRVPPDAWRSGPRWAAVGPRTAAALAESGVAVAAVPDESRGVRVAAAIARVQPLAGLRVLLARADAAANDLPAALREAGAEAEELAVYRTVAGPESSRTRLAAALADPDLRAVVFASGSAVTGLLRLGGDGVRRLPAITIGPATSAVARREGFEVVAEAARPEVGELLRAVGEWDRQI